MSRLRLDRRVYSPIPPRRRQRYSPRCPVHTIRKALSVVDQPWPKRAPAAAKPDILGVWVTNALKSGSIPPNEMTIFRRRRGDGGRSNHSLTRISALLVVVAGFFTPFIAIGCGCVNWPGPCYRTWRTGEVVFLGKVTSIEEDPEQLSSDRAGGAIPRGVHFALSETFGGIVEGSRAAVVFTGNGGSGSAATPSSWVLPTSFMRTLITAG